MNRIVGIVICCLCWIGATAQTTRKIQELEKQHEELQKQISASETLLLSARQDVKSQLENLALLSARIADRKKYLDALVHDVKTVEHEVSRLETEVKALQQEQKKRKDRYDRSLNYMYRNKSAQEKLMFILSADGLSQMYRRLRYVRQYANYQRLQAMQLQRKEHELKKKQQQLEESRKAKEAMLVRGEQEKVKLEAGEREHKEMLASLQKRQREIQTEIKRKRESAQKLNAQIDRLVEQEIDRLRREEEARKRALAQRVKAKKKEGKPVSSSSLAKEENLKKESGRLAGAFEQNRGHLPVPITGAYALIGHYGKYQVDGLRNVRLDNKGVDLKGKPGAQARTVFDGEVTAIFQYNGMANVLVRHGNYISVYCNLSSVLVKKGSILKTKDVIGQVNTDADGNTILHFQLRKETVKLNPEAWIGF